MVSDDASEAPRPKRQSRGSSIDPWQVGLGVLLVLAVIATVVMLFTDSQLWLRIGTLAALWAAFIGAFLVGRYRRQSALETARARDLQTVYELQLEREVNARYEYEIELEKQHREQVEAHTDDSIFALRQEIYALREQLATLTGQPVTDAPPTLAAAKAAQLGPAPERTSVTSERVERWGVDPQSTPSESRTARLSPIRPQARGADNRRPASGPSGFGRDTEASPRRAGGHRPPVRPTGPPVRPSSSREQGPTESSSQSSPPASTRPSPPEAPSQAQSAGPQAERSASEQQGRQAEPRQRPTVPPRTATPRPAPRQEQPMPEPPRSAPRAGHPDRERHREVEQPDPPLSWPLSDDDWNMEFPAEFFTAGDVGSTEHEPSAASGPATASRGVAASRSATAWDAKASPTQSTSADPAPADSSSDDSQESEQRSGDHSQGTSFAEIMARLQSESEPGAGSGGGGRRRRRAAED